ncbi:hypothetical protein [Sulfurimonas sp. HSL-1716]|uniref:hypothetical protein n=1 Tax=Hydrocurvibacter sulfurireducens TaxID=3131937 RepID=UPI0031F79EC0
MHRFWFRLWLEWALRFTLESVFLAFLLSLIVTAAIYIGKGAAAIDKDVLKALLDIFRFWFLIIWNLTLLISLFRGVKYFFNRCHEGYVLKLLTCRGEETIEKIGYGDIPKVFRKWMMAMIWSVSALMVLSFIVSYLFADSHQWYNIYVLYLFILISGAITIPLMGNRCKRVRLMKC